MARSVLYRLANPEKLRTSWPTLPSLPFGDSGSVRAILIDILAETKGERLQRGTVEREWLALEREHTLRFSDEAECEYSHQGDVAAARLQRAVTVRFQNAAGLPRVGSGAIRPGKAPGRDAR